MARVTRYLVDASALIHLDRIGELHVLRELLGKIHVTQEVAREVSAGPDPMDLKSAHHQKWITILPSAKSLPKLGLGKGETSLLLAARPGDRLVLDDAQARAMADARGFELVGLLGLIVAAAIAGKLSRARAVELLDALIATEFRVAPDLYAWARHAMEELR